MKLITRWTMAAEALEVFQQQSRGFWLGDGGLEVQERAREYLERLGASPTPDDFERVFPTSAICTPGSCDECREDSDELVAIGRERVFICAKCLLKAMMLINP